MNEKDVLKHFQLPPELLANSALLTPDAVEESSMVEKESSVDEQAGKTEEIDQEPSEDPSAALDLGQLILDIDEQVTITHYQEVKREISQFMRCRENITEVCCKSAVNRHILRSLQLRKKREVSYSRKGLRTRGSNPFIIDKKVFGVSTTIPNKRIQTSQRKDALKLVPSAKNHQLFPSKIKCKSNDVYVSSLIRPCVSEHRKFKPKMGQSVPSLSPIRTSGKLSAVKRIKKRTLLNRKEIISMVQFRISSKRHKPNPSPESVFTYTESGYPCGNFTANHNNRKSQKMNMLSIDSKTDRVFSIEAISIVKPQKTFI